MHEPVIQDYRRAIEGLHGGEAEYVETVHVIEEFEGERAWDVEVHIFSLTGHPDAEKAYAWSLPIGESERRRFYAILHGDPVDSPENAVRASIVEAARDARNG